jgi:Ca2+-binding RTX toxin-like protein
MNGGDGDDRYYIDNVDDTVTDSSGLDSIYTTIDHTLGTGFERLYAYSDDGFALTGNGTDNTIVGRGGDDIITGGAGRDVMTGGAGADTFVFQALSDSVASAARDVIKDFLIGTDKIDLTAIDANTGLADDQAFTFIGSGGFTHTAGELQAKAAGANTLVSGDVDGNGQADFQILLGGSVALQATDFLL